MKEIPPIISRRYPPKRIEYTTKNLCLRPFEASDAEQFKHVLKDTLPHLYKYMLWPELQWDIEDCLNWVIKRHTEYFTGMEFEWGIFDLKSGELLGSIGIMPGTPFNPDCYEVGYWTASTKMNKGLATIATQIVSVIAFECLDIKRLQVSSIKENQASIRVIEKCGFHFEGELREFFPAPSEEKIKMGAVHATRDYLYSLLPSDCKELPWYDSLKRTLIFHPLYGNRFHVS